MDTLKKFLNDVLKASGVIAKKYFSNEFSVEIKSDESPVTIADKEIEEFIRSRIKKEFPDYGIIGEEFEDHLPEARFKFVIDPIDGTKAFIKGIPTFGIMICVIEEGSPLVSGIYQPITDELWIGDNKTCTKNGIAITTSKTKDISNAKLATTGYDYLEKDGIEAFEKVSDACGQTIIGGDCYNYCKLAEGKIDVVLEQNLKFHDFIPLIPIVKGAGAVISDFSGNKLKSPYGNIANEFLVTSNTNIANAVSKVLKS